MSETRDVQDVVESFTTSPENVDAWLAANQALAARGDRDVAAEGFEALGRAASGLGHVALAVACCRWLLDNQFAELAEGLGDAIASCHGNRARAVGRGAPPAPPAAPRGGAGRTATDLVTAARRGFAAAERAAAERVPDVLPSTPLVNALDPDGVRDLVEVVRSRSVPEGGLVIDVGEPARSLFWVARGSLEVSRRGVELAQLTSGALFGEIALVGATTRTARVRALAPCLLLELAADDVEQLAARAPAVAKVLAEYARSRLLANVMRTSVLFSRVSDRERRQMLRRFSSRALAAGESLITRGKPNDSLYVLVSGNVEVRGGDGAIIAELVPGDGVGEMSLLSGKPAVADVVALAPASVLQIERQVFDEVAVANPGLLAEVYRLKIDRESENADIIHDAADLIV